MGHPLKDLFEGFTFTLVESKEKKYEGVLASVKGAFGLTEETNRNGRIYTNKFWESVLSRPDVKSRLQERAIVGELEHPNSIQTQLGHISHVITDLKVIPEKKELYGEADILDTPSGRILHTLMKAGVKVGISTRGAGSLKEEGAGEGKKKYVNEEDYVFGGLDFVSDPSAPNAFPKLAESQIAALVESLEPHFEEMAKDTDFYTSFLESLGCPQVLQGEPVELLAEDTTPADDETDLDEQAATITDLRSKMRQMVESHRRKTVELAEAQEKVEELETQLLRCESLTEAVEIQKAKALSLRQELEETSCKLVEAQRRLDEAKGEQVEKMRAGALREQKLSKDVVRLEEALQQANQEIEERDTRISSLESNLDTSSSLVESKKAKLGDYRRELLEALSEQFDCDLKALIEGLSQGFTPGDAVRRAAECSRKLYRSSLPLEEGTPLLTVEDEVPPGENAGKSAQQERRRATIRGVRGRK